jgi:hypothetical protein
LAQPQDRFLPTITAAPTESQTGNEGRGPARGSRVAQATLVDAHLFGQKDRRRGLKSGVAGIDAAKSSYLRTQFAAADDRRATPGQVTKVTL